MAQPAQIFVPIYFDYASTLCYIAWRIVRELQQELDFEPLWKGVPIHWRSQASLPGKPLGPAERAKIASVIIQTGVHVIPPERWIASEAALMGSELARHADTQVDSARSTRASSESTFERFHAGVFRAAFEQGQDISGLDQLAAIAAGAGMDPDEFRHNLNMRLTAGQIQENRQEADHFSALGYPTFMLGEFPLTGIQPKDTMRLLLERFLAQRRRMLQA